MINAKLGTVSVIAKYSPLLKRFGQPNVRWYAVFQIEITDPDNKHVVMEWIYLMACSKEYWDKPQRSGPTLSSKYTIIQDTFDEAAIKTEAQKRFDSIEANDWDEFYKKIDNAFLYED